MGFISLTCFPAIEDNGYIVMLFLAVIDQGCYESFSLLLQV